MQLAQLDPRDPFRARITEQLLEKLYAMGIVNTKKGLAECDKVTASAFCRRRLPVVMVRLKFAESIREAVTFIEQGHVRVGPNVILDPAFLVTRYSAHAASVCGIGSVTHRTHVRALSVFVHDAGRWRTLSRGPTTARSSDTCSSTTTSSTTLTCCSSTNVGRLY